MRVMLVRDIRGNTIDFMDGSQASLGRPSGIPHSTIRVDEGSFQRVFDGPSVGTIFDGPSLGTVFDGPSVGTIFYGPSVGTVFYGRSVGTVSTLVP
jgi:hypothetical protein